MSGITSDRVIVGCMMAIVIIGVSIKPGLAGYLSILLTVVFAFMYWLTQTRSDRLFYLACCGALLAAICASVWIWEGLLIAWMAAGVMATATGISLSIHDLPVLLVSVCATVAIALLVDMANHVYLPIAVLCGITFIVLVVMAIRHYQFQKQYSGEDTA